jgi:Asparagine synthase (glutamine-hydrolyzing)
MTKEAGVTMAMSGLGGDELFAGYDVFKRLYYLNKFRMVGKAPLKLRTLSSHVLDMGKPSVPVFKVKELLQLKNWNFVNTYPLSRRILSDDTIRSFVTNSELPLNGVESIVEKQNAFARGSHFLSLVSEAEMATYMQNVLLRDTDQMSMAHALEVRVPFLDYQLVEYVLQVPDDYKYPHSPKQLLVESVGNLLPEGFGQRRKMGFTLPWNYWMRDQLMPFCEHQLKSLSKQEYFNSQGLMQFWRRFQNHDPLITWSRVWTLVALGNWLKANNIS